MKVACLVLAAGVILLASAWSVGADRQWPEVPPTRPATQATTGPTTQPLDEKTKARVRDLIKQLGDDAVEVREEATRRLIELGPAVEPLVDQAGQASSDPEVRSRCQFVLMAFRLARLKARPMTAFDPLTGLLVRAKAGNHEGLTRVWAQRDEKQVWQIDLPVPVALVKSVTIDGGTVALEPAGWTLDLASGRLISNRHR